MTVTTSAIDSSDASGLSESWLRRARLLASALAVASILETLVALVISAGGDKRFPIEPDLATLGFLGNVVLFPVVGALIVQQRPLTRVAWLMIVTGLGLGLGVLTFGYGATGMPPAPPRAGALEVLVISRLFAIPPFAAATVFLLLLFPTDRLPTPRWRFVAFAGVAGTVAYELGTLFVPGELDAERFPGVTNPIGAPEATGPFFQLLLGVGNGLITAAIVLAALSLVVRYRRADPVEAAQIRWIALVAALAAAVLTLSTVLSGREADLAFGAGLVLLACMPIAIGIAITRYHLYDIDRLINRTLVYGSLTAILAGIFTAGIGLAQRVFVATTGQSSDAAIVLTTLVVATAYAPLRKRLEAIVERRFKYEAGHFGQYRDEVSRVLSVVDPMRAAQRLVSEAVLELGATGGAVLGEGDRPLATAGEWPVVPIVNIWIRGGPGALESIVLGPRRDGQAHDPRAIAELEQTAELVALAVHRGASADR